MESKFSAAERPCQRGRPAGGFALVLVWQICRVWSRYKSGELRFADVRVWLAACEAQERRCGLEEDRTPVYTHRELENLTGLSERVVQASLRRLTTAGLLAFETNVLSFGSRKLNLVEITAREHTMLADVQNHRRAVPVPRRSLRLLAQAGKPAVVATALGHLFRCVYYRGGELVSWGRCKASWIADVFGIDQRSVKSARAHLIELGWLVKISGTGGFAAKRWGGEYQVELSWARPESYACSARFSPDPDEPCIKTSPCKNQTPLFQRDLKNQTLAARERTGAETKAKGGAVGRRMAAGRPTMQHLVREDLTDTRRTLELFEQAAAMKLIAKSEHGRLLFVSLAEHALMHGTRNPCGLFVKLLRERRIAYITQDDEEAARQRINRELYQVARRAKVQEVSAPLPRVRLLSDGEKLVRACLLVGEKRRIDPYIVARQVNPWTREQWAQELEAFHKANDG